MPDVMPCYHSFDKYHGIRIDASKRPARLAEEGRAMKLFGERGSAWPITNSFPVVSAQGC